MRQPLRLFQPTVAKMMANGDRGLMIRLHFERSNRGMKAALFIFLTDSTVVGTVRIEWIFEFVGWLRIYFVDFEALSGIFIVTIHAFALLLHFIIDTFHQRTFPSTPPQ